MVRSLPPEPILKTKTIIYVEARELFHVSRNSIPNRDPMDMTHAQLFGIGTGTAGLATTWYHSSLNAAICCSSVSLSLRLANSAYRCMSAGTTSMQLSMSQIKREVLYFEAIENSLDSLWQLAIHELQAVRAVRKPSVRAQTHTI